MVAVPETDAVKLAVQLAVPTVDPATRVQGDPVKLPVAPVEPKATVPVGVVAPDVLLDVTVAVQVDAWATTTGPGHETFVVVG
jgi:hypothetical protein